MMAHAVGIHERGDILKLFDSGFVSFCGNIRFCLFIYFCRFLRDGFANQHEIGIEYNSGSNIVFFGVRQQFDDWRYGFRFHIVIGGTKLFRKLVDGFNCF
ncbi:Uncharacterised protein [Slackia heliotrinireducens]|uniref:Uncharacterized protein n=1 Tax=Slackia heliotrinireducens (strain ATCC 29202 / DSM 20476 / NCTC 11029 / RHS 1) TaxID=471855 RepID=C7N2B4_SLAHD|nr:hypothetical protein Shel_03570 [Slackia heliotrinireducens DSM 20476]VEG98857.1 Uncharacterised protein [Slackia heliotrinireducens]